MLLLGDARLASDLTRGPHLPWTIFYKGAGWKPIEEILAQFAQTHTPWELTVVRNFTEQELPWTWRSVNPNDNPHFGEIRELASDDCPVCEAPGHGDCRLEVASERAKHCPRVRCQADV